MHFVMCMCVVVLFVFKHCCYLVCVVFWLMCVVVVVCVLCLCVVSCDVCLCCLMCCV